MSADEQGQALARKIIRQLDGQIATAKAGGANDTTDCCIVFPPGYMALVTGMPLLEVDGELKAVATIRVAEGMVRTLKAESGWL